MTSQRSSFLFPVPGRGLRVASGSPGAAFVTLLLALASTTGCGNVCGDAIEVCRYDEASEPDDCSGATECASLCVVDWDACDVNNPDSPESKCIASCLEATEEP